MRICYLVAYDISEDKRLRRVAKVMEEYGSRIQYSVFRCELTKLMRAMLEADLEKEINHSCDQVLFIRLGPVSGRAGKRIYALGRPYIPPERDTVVL
ncbi:CRISPR-associated endonuclease Cas2 [bacterium]|nr:CRISPR-associated endonuclease Cas2 [candidate division CSSED10-310 bacterium]